MEREQNIKTASFSWRRRSIELIAIVASILVSFFLEDLRQENEEVEKKNELLSDLSIVINEDLKQIQALQETLEESLTCIAQLQDDIASNHAVMTDMEALEAVLCVEVGHSFFPKDGVYEQMVATGALKLDGAPIAEFSLETKNQDGVVVLSSSAAARLDP